MEEMRAFFTRRVEGYDEHMLQNVAGCAEGYALLAQNLPDGAEDVLDLGCGTGLELDAMLAKRRDLRVTGSQPASDLRRLFPNRLWERVL